MKLSARNVLEGTAVEISTGAVTSAPAIKLKEETERLAGPRRFVIFSRI